MKRALLLAVLCLAACRSERPSFVEIESSDMCAYCKMAISEKRYASELIDEEGGVLKFDDLGCMFRMLKERSPQAQPSAFFVVDYERRTWLDASQGHFVKSEVFHSPMGSGLIALGDRAKAEAYAQKYHGQVLRFDDLRKQ